MFDSFTELFVEYFPFLVGVLLLYHFAKTSSLNNRIERKLERLDAYLDNIVVLQVVQPTNSKESEEKKDV